MSVSLCSLPPMAYNLTSPYVLNLLQIRMQERQTKRGREGGREEGMEG